MTWATYSVEGDLVFHDGLPSLEQMQAAVGGYIEHVALNAIEVSMFLNEEGKLDGLPHNAGASRLCRETGAGLALHDLIVGNVLFVGPANKRGDSTSLAEWQIQYLKDFARFQALIDDTP